MERPCPEYFNGIKYNTTRECPLLVSCWPPRKAVQEEGRPLNPELDTYRGSLYPRLFRELCKCGGTPSVPNSTTVSNPG